MAEQSEWAEHRRRLAGRLHSAGYRLTPPRRAVLEVLEASHEHLSHAEVLKRAQAIYPMLGRATVYRTLELLTSMGVVRPIYLGAQGVCFTRADSAHHHMICSCCGAVTEIEGCAIDEMQEDLSERLHFSIKGHLLEFYGLCEQCQQE